MKQLIFVLIVGLMIQPLILHAEETLEEKFEDKTNDLKRASELQKNRVEEALCAEGDLACLKEKASNRLEETGKAIGDKASEIKNDID
ncbi:MAG: hypothetical protein K0U68_03605 [Gammaproteobacteria bacterium]|nr:hypothetical protein [Gammaproteobacteria bacterium]